MPQTTERDLPHDSDRKCMDQLAPLVIVTPDFRNKEHAKWAAKVR